MKCTILFIISIVIFITTDLYAQNVGIGTDNPLEFFSVGANSQFRVNANGDIVRIKNISYTFPSSQGATNTYLRNDGSGNLSWQTISITTGSISASGTASNSTFLRGDGAWATPAGGSGVILVTTASIGTTVVPTTTTLGAGTQIFTYQVSQSGIYCITGFIYKTDVGDGLLSNLYIRINGTIAWSTNVSNGLSNYLPAGLNSMISLSANDIISITVQDLNGSTFAGGSVRLFKL